MSAVNRWQKDWRSCDGLSDVEITVDGPDGSYPALVSIEAIFYSLISDDVRDLAALLLKAADIADQAMTQKETR